MLYVGRERNVSGGANLANRLELSRAVEAVEAGNADIIVAAYFDRFFRSLEVQGEVIGRIERAGGELLTLDHGRLTNGTPANRLQANIVGAMAQFFREQTTEKSAAGQAAAVARGATPWARIPLGYTRENGKLLVDEATKPIVQRVFDMRAEGVSISQIRKFLAEHGVERSHRGVQVMLASRIYLGEIHFGKLHNYEAHSAIVDKELWDRVQRMVVARGRQPSSDRLLARLGVLRCGSCGSPLGTMKLPRQNDYPIYRCGSTNDCDHHVTISAVIAEDVVSAAVRAALTDVEGRASMETEAREASTQLAGAQDALDAALRSFTTAGLTDEPAAVQRLGELRQARDDAQARVDRVSPSRSLTINAAVDWDDLTRDEQRALIRATVESAVVAPTGRGASRVSVRLFGHETA